MTLWAWLVAAWRFSAWAATTPPRANRDTPFEHFRDFVAADCTNPLTMTASLMSTSADYGIDAPHVVRNLFIVAILGLGLWGAAFFRFWSGLLVIPLGKVRIFLPLGTQGLWAGTACGFMGIWMIWSSK